jgi:uncharacterized protein YxjI
MRDDLSSALASGGRLVIKQQKHWGEILTGFEAKSAYEICTERGDTVGRVGERSTGLLSTLGRWMFKGRRPFELVVESDGGMVLFLRRPWFWWFSSLEVNDGAGNPLGRIEQRFAFFQRRFDLQDSAGRLLATVIGPFFHPWTFEIHAGDGGRELGRIEKRWSGFGRELFTDADNFSLTLPESDPVLAKLVLAAALLVDFCYFENSGKESGLLGMLTD